jgi:anthranilate/para-aminobenzoate synthase component II
MMEIGIVNMYDTNPPFLVNAIKQLDCRPYVINYSENVLHIIKKSKIKKWIFSGANEDVLENVKQVPLELLTLKDKQFMMICYSMESVLIQLGYEIKKRFHKRTEYFNMNVLMYKIPADFKYLFERLESPMKMYREHLWYFNAADLGEFSKVSYNGETMMAFYNNSVLVQFHPEKSIAGKKLLNNWIIN